MRVLLLTQYIDPEPFPINAMLRSWKAAGAEITVLTGQPNYPDGVVYPGFRAWGVTEGRILGEIPVFRVPTIPRGSRSALRLFANYLFFVFVSLTLGVWLLRGRRFDVVFVYAPSPITQSIAGAALARLKRARLVTWVQDLWPQSLEATGFVRNRSLLRGAEAGVRWIYRCHDLLLGQSEAFVSAIKAMAPGVPVRYLPNPGGGGEPGAELARGKELRLGPGFNVVFAGNLGSVQSLETIIDAADRLRAHTGIRFVLVGSGSRAAWLAGEVARRKLENVDLPGRFPRHHMEGILSQADAVLVTLSRSPILAQTVPSKIQGYLASGRPILAALDGEGARVVEELGAGLSSPAEDAEALAANVLRLEAMSERERAQMGEAGRSGFERHFHPDAVAGTLMRMLRELDLGRGSSPPSSSAG